MSPQVTGNTAFSPAVPSASLGAMLFGIGRALAGLQSHSVKHHFTQVERKTSALL